MKTALITGGSRGIGRACVLKFAREGYRVFYCFSSHEGEIDTGDITGDIIGCRADVSDEKQVSDFVDCACGPNGIDTAVCNAGISRWGLFTDTTEKEWDEIFAVNTKGVFLTAKHAAKKMLARHSGSIITVSSVWGQTGASCEAAYSASKAAVIGFTKAIAKELAPSGITANCICPGVIDTGMNSGFTPDELNAIKENIPLGRFGSPDEAADAVFFLSQSRYITGQVLAVNGGMYI